MRVPTRFVVSSALLCLVAVGCPDEEVSHTRIIKEPAAPEAPALPPGHPSLAQPPSSEPMAPEQPQMAHPGPPPGMEGKVPPPPRPTGANQLTWTLPQGWTQELTGGMRYATLKAPATGNLDISVVVLGGPAGGELANVNRWRGQIGLPPLGEESLTSARKTVATKVGPVALYDFTSEGNLKTRLVAGLAQNGDNTWFFKMTGDAPAADAALGGFTSLLKSLKPGQPASP